MRARVGGGAGGVRPTRGAMHAIHDGTLRSLALCVVSSCASGAPPTRLCHTLQRRLHAVPHVGQLPLALVEAVVQRTQRLKGGGEGGGEGARHAHPAQEGVWPPPPGAAAAVARRALERSAELWRGAPLAIVGAGAGRGAWPRGRATRRRGGRVARTGAGQADSRAEGALCKLCRGQCRSTRVIRTRDAPLPRDLSSERVVHCKFPSFILTCNGEGCCSCTYNIPCVGLMFL